MDVYPETYQFKGGVLLFSYKDLLSLRKASWVFGRDRAFVGLLIGQEFAIFIVGEKFIFTRRLRYQFSNHIGEFHAEIFT